MHIMIINKNLENTKFLDEEMAQGLKYLSPELT